ncbi:pentatricopeptide repeat-containing protein 1, mitochondrial [Eurosta solidaginis]|uniref:pentatricopeptide repeat-containing protein 1, mitochondrial n=1 Tax=Eurosta solidaginis TaxID=178769 RepID=UPI003530DB35
MAIRLFQGRTMCQLWTRNNQMTLKLGLKLYSSIFESMGNYSSDRITNVIYNNNARCLHVKVYDKDIDLQARHNKGHLNPFVSSKMTEIESNRYTIKQESDHQNNDPDTFGTSTLAEDTNDPGDVEEEEFTQNPQRKSQRIIDYARLIKSHLHQKRLKDALAVLEEQMLKKDRVKPDVYIYNLLISGCAKYGYTRKAFNLFTKMRQRGFQVKGGTYSSLFNACANAPSAPYGLEQANRLREIMLEKGYEPNVKNYNAMIKAYGRCGDVKTAYLLADELIEKRLPLTTETFNFLLQACASDFEFGFRHCLLTWHKMVQHGLKPDYYTFNTVLRCVRDCGFGDLNTMEKLLQQIFIERKELPSNPEEQPILISEKQKDNNNNNLSNIQPEPQALKIKNESLALELPNLLARHPHLGSLVSLAEVKLPHERFLLIGGLTSFLQLMKESKVTPSIETFTTLLEVIPPTYAAEKQLLSFVRKIGLKADIDFFNILIKKRSMRFDYEGAKEIISMIHTARLQPDIVTYGVLALGCQTQNEARELLQEMQEKGIRMNTQILGAMLRQGAANRNFPYIIEIMQISLDENIKPNEMFLTHLHKFYDNCARSIDARHPSTKTKSFKNGHAKFCDKLRTYYEEQGLSGLKLEDAIKKIRQHPDKQFKEEDIDGIEPVKNEALSKKQKIRKYIKKIKIENLRNDIQEDREQQIKLE